MTQTNQNKDYSWLRILIDRSTDTYVRTHEKWGSWHKYGIVDREQLFKAIQTRIDEHYIGKGEAIIRITDAELDEVVNQIGKFLDKGLPGNAAVRLRQFANKVKARSESEVEQRCIEAYKQGRIDEARVCEQAKRHQLSTNNKDTLERSSDDES